MTIEEAIKRLKVLTDYEYDKDLEALNMAIEALEKEDVLDKIRAEILENAFSVVNPKNTYEYINVLDLGNIEKIINKYKAESEE